MNYTRRWRAVVTLAVLVVSSLAWGSAVRAQDAKVNDQRLDYYAKQLKLTADQKAKVGHILSVDRQMDGVNRKQYKDDPVALREATAKRIAETNREIEALLTADQKPLLATLKPFRPKGNNRFTEELVTRLKLDSKQGEKIEQIMAGSRLGELRSEMQSAGRDRDKRRELMTAMRSESQRIDDEIEKVLTPDQKKEYEKMKEERRERMEERRPESREGRRGGGMGGGGGQGGW